MVDNTEAQHSISSSNSKTSDVVTGTTLEVTVTQDVKELHDTDDDWETSGDNPRNWSFGRKWTAAAIVRKATSCTSKADYGISRCPSIRLYVRWLVR